MAEDLSAIAADLIDIHLGLQNPGEAEPWHYVHEEEQLRKIILSANASPVGHTTSALEWFAPPPDQAWCICGEAVFKMPRLDDRGRAPVKGLRWELWAFNEDGELLKEDRIHAISTPGDWQNVLHAPVLVRRAGETRPLTSAEAWGALAALFRAFADVRPTLTRASEAAVIGAMRDLEADVRSIARRLRAPELWLLRRGAHSEVLEAISEQFANSVGKVRGQLEGKREKRGDAWVQFIGPCAACFQMLFGTAATPGADCNPSPFTLFVEGFLAEMDVQLSWRSVRTYFARRR